MTDFGLYFDIIKAFEDLNVPYVIIGAYAAAVFGSTRVTYDIDIVVDLNEYHINVIADRFPLPRYLLC